jgi:outer membrane receptor protein involved in Fe transport
MEDRAFGEEVMRRQNRGLVPALSICLSLIGTAHGQSPSTPTAGDAQPTAVASSDANEESLERAEVKGHYDTAIGSSDAASQGVVEGDLLRDVPLLRPGEVLETVPGLVVTQHSGDGKANQYFLRGYNLDHGTDLATFVDQVPVNMPTNAHGQGYSDLNFLIPELIDQIGYRKGPYYAQYGDFASAGAVDVHYVDSLDQNLADFTVGDDGYRRLLLAGSCSVTDSGCRAPSSIGINLGTSGPRILGAIEGLEENGPWTLPEGLHKFNGLLRLSDGTIANGWSLDAILYEAHWDSTDQVPLALIQSGQLGRFSALDPTDGGDSGRDLVAGEWHASDASGYTHASFFLEHYRLQLWSDFTFFELRPDTGDQFEQEEHRNLEGGDLVRGWNHDLFRLQSTTEVGLQLRHDNIDVGLFNTENRQVFQTVSNENVDETALGLYAQNTTPWLPWFRSVVGVREDHVSMNATSYSTPQNTGRAAAGKLSPKASLIFGPWMKTELFLDAGKGFHSNDARGVIDRIDPTTGAASAQVPALVGSLGKEIGMRTELVPGLQSSFALWSLNSDSELVYDADSAIGSTSPNAASKRYGVEWNNHLIENSHLLFDADLAWTHARYAEENQNGELGDMIPNAVSAVAIFRATLQDIGPWTLGWETRYIGSYPLSQDGSLTASPSWITNLRVKADVNPSVSVYLDVLNLFNRAYDDIEYEQDYRASKTSPVVPAGVTIHPGEPREFRITLSVKI